MIITYNIIRNIRIYNSLPIKSEKDENTNKIHVKMLSFHKYSKM